MITEILYECMCDFYPITLSSQDAPITLSVVYASMFAELVVLWFDCTLAVHKIQNKEYWDN